MSNRLTVKTQDRHAHPRLPHGAQHQPVAAPPFSLPASIHRSSRRARPYWRPSLRAATSSCPSSAPSAPPAPAPPARASGAWRALWTLRARPPATSRPRCAPWGARTASRAGSSSWRTRQVRPHHTAAAHALAHDHDHERLHACAKQACHHGMMHPPAHVVHHAVPVVVVVVGAPHRCGRAHVREYADQPRPKCHHVGHACTVARVASVLCCAVGAGLLLQSGPGTLGSPQASAQLNAVVRANCMHAYVAPMSPVDQGTVNGALSNSSICGTYVPAKIMKQKGTESLARLAAWLTDKRDASQMHTCMQAGLLCAALRCAVGLCRCVRSAA